MSDCIGCAMLKQDIEEKDKTLARIRSGMITLLLNVKVMLEDGDLDEALEFIKEHVE